MRTDFFVGKRKKEIIEEAKKLGFEQVYYVKIVSKPEEIKREEKKSYDCVLLKTNSEDELRKMIDRAFSFSYKVLVLGTTDRVNRIALENKKVFALVSPEYERKNDYLDYRNSGLNHVLCKIATSNNKHVILSFKELLGKKSKEKALIIGRMIQNIKLCRKYKTSLKIASFASNINELRSIFDLRSFLFSLGADTMT
ncbi:MAG TPA: hypothetical protein ENF67_01005, partial [Candidatus Pacearchaeota archaeon]|nr:hypothetical protein [Candidatus Pacearchaeota archaeon]